MPITARAKQWTALFGKIRFIALTLLILVVALPTMFLVARLIDVAQNHVTLSADQLSVQASNISNLVSPAKTLEKPVQPIISNLGQQPPAFSSLGVLAMDYDTGQILFAKNIHTHLSPASTTKLMTAIVSTEYFKLEDVLHVFSEDAVGGSSMGLHTGELVTFRGLLYGMLLNSGNDAAFTIASNYPGGMLAFVAAMNQKAKSLGLTDTNFQNPAGFDGDAHYSSAYDLAQIAATAVKNDQISKIVATKDTSITAMDSSKEHLLHNLNQLLDVPGVIGIKTGFTEKSGENLVGLVERENHKVLTVVLGSKDRFGETKSLMDWVYSNFKWTE